MKLNFFHFILVSVFLMSALLSVLCMVVALLRGEHF